MSSAKWVGRTARPEILGTRYAVSAGHYLAASAAMRILDDGGNAFDAGVAAGLCLNVVQPDLTNLGGVAPACVYRAATATVETVSGLGWWPAQADASLFDRVYGGRIRRGIHRCVIPAAIDTWLTVLSRHGTMRFAQVAAAAIEYAQNGFPMHPVMHATLADPAALRAMRSWPSTRTIYLDERGMPGDVGQVVIQKDLAATLRKLVEAETAHDGREEGLAAARDRFYCGDIAQAMVDFSGSQGGWLQMQDLADFRVSVEDSVSTSYRGYDVHACGAWCQGAVVLMALNILEGYDIAALPVGGTQQHHLAIEALKSAFADRDRYFTDPRFGDVPMDGLLSKAYAATRRSRISATVASPGMPMPGDAWAFSGRKTDTDSTWEFPVESSGPDEPDTSYLCVVDSEGNAFSATPSDGVTSAPLVPGLGFIISSRGMQSWLDPRHPAALRPGKRPRLTPSPGMILKDGRLVGPYGTPGNDVQPQAMLQFLLNFIDHGMGVQEAVEAPRSATYSFPHSSDPHAYTPGLVRIEARVGESTVDGLRRLGHRVEAWPEWTGSAGSLGAIVAGGPQLLRAAADPRRTAYAIAR